jgi:flagellar basal-body rod protein FlgC
MDYFSAFDISASGLSVEKARLDVTAVNLANASSTRSADGVLFKPLRVVSGPKLAPTFSQRLDNLLQKNLSVSGVQIRDVREIDANPRLVHDPGHPDADDKGFVAYPPINPVTEMVQLMTATRAYEANIRAMNAAKTMALKALEIGGNQ